MSEKGTLTKSEEKLLGKAMDPLIDFTKFKSKGLKRLILKYVEKKDENIFTEIVEYLDDTLADRLPESLKPLARDVALSVIHKDKNEFIRSSTILSNRLIDIPLITEDTEAIILGGVLKGMLDALPMLFK